jgi:sarcosine oxidase gamma subunit
MGAATGLGSGETGVQDSTTDPGEMTMVNKEAIDAALAAHAQWKKRLQEAIETGQSTFAPDTARKDNVCQFGQWLYALPDADRQTTTFAKVRELHAAFHSSAGEILRLALSGKKAEALKALEFGGPYGKATGELVLALQTWKQQL